MKTKPIAKTALWLMLAAPGLMSAAQAQVDQTALDNAFQNLPQYQLGQPEEMLQVIDAAVAAAQNQEPSRLNLEQRLIAVLTSDATQTAKKFACRKLALLGTAKAAGPLARLLDDPDLAHMARFALERIPDPAADEALRTALDRTTGGLKVGIINSLGNRQDQLAVPGLSLLLKAPDPQVAQAAIAALGNIGTAHAAQALAQLDPAANSQLRLPLEDAQLKVAENLVRQGQKDQALPLYRHLHLHGSSEHVQLAGFKGLLPLEPGLAQDRLLQALAAPGTTQRGLAARTIAELPAGQDLSRFLEALPALPAAGQVALIDTFAARRETAAQAAVRNSVQSSEPIVRLAALSALGEIGTAADVLLLAEKAATAQNPENQTAQLSLAKLAPEDVNAQIVAGLAKTTPPVRIALIHALVTRSATGAAHSIARQIGDPEPDLRRTAIDAVGALGSHEQIPALLDALRSPQDPASMSALESALKSVCARNPAPSSAIILAALPKFQGPQRVALLNTLSLTGNADALAVLWSDTTAADPDVKDAAVRGLADWPDSAALVNLLSLAKSAPERRHRIVAFRGYVRLLRAAPWEAEIKTRALDEAMQIALRREEQLLALAGFGDMPQLPSLKRTEKYLHHPELAEEACVTISKIAAGLDASAKYDVAAALEQVLQITREQRTREEAERILGKHRLPRLAATGKSPSHSSLKRIVFVAGPMDHAGPGAHEYPKDLLLLKYCLDQATHPKGFTTEIHFGKIPADIAKLNTAATIVIHSSGDRLKRETHALFPSSHEAGPQPYTGPEETWFAQFDAVMKQGCGMVVLHYALWTDHPASRSYMLDWIGGYHDKDQSRVQIVSAEVKPAAPDHPILRGVAPWTTQEEYYFQQHFRPKDDRLVPILLAPSPTDTAANDVIAWAVERPGGGRGFGFTGCHYHRSLLLQNYRRLVLNAILWTAGLEVPTDGMKSEPPNDWR